MSERLAASIDAVRVADERMQIRIDSSVANALAQRNSLERCQANIRIAAADADQLVLCVGNVLPDGLAPGTVQGLLSGCCGSEVAMGMGDISQYVIYRNSYHLISPIGGK